jgi:hypothetical protein
VSSRSSKKALAAPTTSDFITRAEDVPKLCADLHVVGWTS